MRVILEDMSDLVRGVVLGEGNPFQRRLTPAAALRHTTTSLRDRLQGATAGVVPQTKREADGSPELKKPSKTKPPRGDTPDKDLCRLFASTGQCRYGDACKFKHIYTGGGAAAPVAASGVPPGY